VAWGTAGTLRAGQAGLRFLPELSFGCIGYIPPCLGRKDVAKFVVDLGSLAADCCRTCTKMPDHVGCGALHKIAIFHCIPASLLQAGVRFLPRSAADALSVDYADALPTSRGVVRFRQEPRRPGAKSAR
jgi:hypothetical protein